MGKDTIIASLTLRAPTGLDVAVHVRCFSLGYKASWRQPIFNSGRLEYRDSRPNVRECASRYHETLLGAIGEAVGKITSVVLEGPDKD